MFAVRDFEEVSPQAMEFYSDRGIKLVFSSGGAPIVVVVGGAGIAAGVLIVGDIVVDELWTEFVLFFDSKRTDTQIAWISNCFGGLPNFVDSTGERFSQRFEEAGWEDDYTNYWAERNEVLDDLRDMDGDDIFVFYGHSFIVANKTGADKNKIDGLWGSSWSLTDVIDKLNFETNSLTPRLLKWAMDGEAPGLVIIMGCQSADGGAVQKAFLEEVDKPAKAYIGINNGLIDGVAGPVTMKLLEELVVNKRTIQEAIDLATEKGQGTYHDFYFGLDNGDQTVPLPILNLIIEKLGLVIFKPKAEQQAKERQMIVVPASAGSKTIHELLCVQDPRECE